MKQINFSILIPDNIDYDKDSFIQSMKIRLKQEFKSNCYVGVRNEV